MAISAVCLCLLGLLGLCIGQQAMVHPGQCPRPSNRGAACGQPCRNDGACDRDAKCCESPQCGRSCVKINANQKGGAQGQRQQFGAGQGSASLNRNLPSQQQFLLQQQQQLQLAGQPSLVNVGGCSRGVSLRNSDGSTLVCGFGPRDFACPPGFGCIFDSSLRALVCCPAENSTRASDVNDESINSCPEGEPLKDAAGSRVQCNFGGSPSNACPTGTICVVGACCPVSIAGLMSVKPGKCPLPLPAAPGTNCQNDCTFDADCPGPAKCCFVGCGARCVTSTSSVANGAFGEGIAQSGLVGNGGGINGGPLSGNAASISQFELLPGRNDQRGQQGFNAQNNFLAPQNGFGNNGPPGSFGNGRGPQRGGPPGNGPRNSSPRPSARGQQPQQNNRQFSRQFDQA